MSALEQRIPQHVEPFVWNRKREQAAMMLAAGYRKTEVARELQIDRSTVYEWLDHPDFYCEVDRLTFMVDVAVRAERIRKSMRLLRSREVDGVLQSDKDSLDWMKFVQSETDGAKVDLTKLSELFYDTDDGPRSNLPSKIADIEAGYNRGLLLSLEGGDSDDSQSGEPASTDDQS